MHFSFCSQTHLTPTPLPPSAQSQVHPKHKPHKKQVEPNKPNRLPQKNLSTQIHVEQEQGRGQIEHHVPNERRRVQREGRGVNRHEADHEGRDERPGGEDRAEAGPVLTAADGGDGGENVRRAVAEGEERDGGHARRQIEGESELGGDEREVILGGLDEDVEEEEEDEREGGERKDRVLAEEADVEVEVVEEAIGVGDGGARRVLGGEEGPVGVYGKWGGVVWGLGIWGCEEEEEEGGDEC